MKQLDTAFIEEYNLNAISINAKDRKNVISYLDIEYEVKNQEDFLSWTKKGYCLTYERDGTIHVKREIV